MHYDSAFLFGLIMLNISILTIGDEICIGQIVNTNAAWIAAQCTSLGARVIKHTSIGDEKNVIINEINDLMRISDFVLVTGGLGPTHDDITKPVLCEFFDDVLVEDKDTLNHVEQFFVSRNRAFTERNRMQALLPSKCKPLRNDCGTAPGMLFEYEDKVLISMPGVPTEMKFLMNTWVLDLIKNEIIKRKFSITKFKTLNTTSIPESFLADLIGNPEEFLDGGSLAFLPSASGVKLRIGVESDSFESAEMEINRIKDIIYSKAGKYIYQEDDLPLAFAVGELLKSKGLTLSVAESCSAGLLGSEICSVAGSSSYFLGGIICYSNESKIRELNVSPANLESYGAVSSETAFELAKNARERFDTDFALSITGIAGPDGGTDEKPVGTVWFGLADRTETITEKYWFAADRNANRERAVNYALAMLLKKIK